MRRSMLARLILYLLPPNSEANNLTKFCNTLLRGTITAYTPSSVKHYEE